jgi:hypothetical protein
MQAKSVQTGSPADDDAQVLTISPEKVCFVIIKAREYDAKDEVTEVDPGSNPSDERSFDAWLFLRGVRNRASLIRPQATFCR